MSRFKSSQALRKITLIVFKSTLNVHGLAYVGLTRCRTKTRNSLVADMCVKDFRVDEDVKEEHERFSKTNSTFGHSYPLHSTATLSLPFHKARNFLAYHSDECSCVMCNVRFLLIFCVTCLTDSHNPMTYCLTNYRLNTINFLEEASDKTRGGSCGFVNGLTPDGSISITADIVTQSNFCNWLSNQVPLSCVSGRPQATQINISAKLSCSFEKQIDLLNPDIILSHWNKNIGVTVRKTSSNLSLQHKG